MTPQRGLLGPANTPYLLVSAVSLVVLIGYLALGDPFAPSGSAGGGATTTTAAAAATSTTLASDGSTTTADAGVVALGEGIFNSTCIACHGLGGVGVAGLGKPLVGSEFVSGLTDDELVQFIIAGRTEDDPLNTTGMAMPPRGGNASLTDDDLRAVVAYLRSLSP